MAWRYGTAFSVLGQKGNKEVPLVDGPNLCQLHCKAQSVGSSILVSVPVIL